MRLSCTRSRASCGESRGSFVAATTCSNISCAASVALRAFHAAGGRRDFWNVLETEVPWLRKRFVEAYEEACEHANAERAATLALKDADARVRTITSDLAAKLAMPDAKQLLGGTARAS